MASFIDNFQMRLHVRDPQHDVDQGGGDFDPVGDRVSGVVHVVPAFLVPVVQSKQGDIGGGSSLLQTTA